MPPVIGDDAYQRFDIWFVFWVEYQPQAVPVLGEHGAEVFGIQWQVVVGEPDPAAKLRVAGQLTFEPGHTDQDQPDVAAVEVVADLLQPGGLEPISLSTINSCVRCGQYGNDISGS